ncbi:hypothetical protein BGZ74_001488, partial [Mortierella antarctica]
MDATESFRSHEKVAELLSKLYTHHETMRLTPKSNGHKPQKELPKCLDLDKGPHYSGRVIDLSMRQKVEKKELDKMFIVEPTLPSRAGTSDDRGGPSTGVSASSANAEAQQDGQLQSEEEKGVQVVSRGQGTESSSAPKHPAEASSASLLEHPQQLMVMDEAMDKDEDEDEDEDKEDSPKAASPRVDSLKKQFQAAFKPVTLNTGTVMSCLCQATSMSKHKSKVIAQQLSEGVTKLSEARIIAWKAIELFILDSIKSCLPLNDPMPTTNASAKANTPQTALPSEPLPGASFGKTVGQGHDGSTQDTPDDLDLLLDKQYGQGIFKVLLSYVITGELSRRGPKVKDPKTLLCHDIACCAYQLLKVAVPGIQPMSTKSTVPIGVPQDEVAKSMIRDLCSHYNKLPETITARKEKIQVLQSNELEDKLGDIDDGDDDQACFKNGHVVSCWGQWCELPVLTRPSFCPSASLTDASLLFSERALLHLLWQPRTTSREYLENAGITQKTAENWVTKDCGCHKHASLVP